MALDASLHHSGKENLFLIGHFYRMYQGFRLNLGERSKMIITLEVHDIFRGGGAIAKIGASLKPKCQIKLSLSKSLIQIVSQYNIVVKYVSFCL